MVNTYKVFPLYSIILNIMDNHLAHSLERQLLMFMNDPYNQPQPQPPQRNYTNPQRAYNTFTGLPRTSPTPASSFENNYFIIRELLSVIREYQQNIRLYNHNLTSLLHLMNNCFYGRGGRHSNVSFQDTPSTTFGETNDNVPPEPATPAPRRERTTDNTNHINETTTSTLLSYILRMPNTNSATSPQTSLNNTQINARTRIIVYDSSMNDTRCPISLDDFVPGEEILQINFCGHIFKKNVLLEWFMRNTHCPVCRHNLASVSVSAPASNLRPPTRLNHRYTTIDPSYAEESNMYSNAGNTPTTRSNVFRTRNSEWRIPSEQPPSPEPSRAPEPEPQPEQNVYTNLFTFEIPIYLDGSNNIVFGEEEDAELNIVSDYSNASSNNTNEYSSSQMENNNNDNNEHQEEETIQNGGNNDQEEEHGEYAEPNATVSSQSRRLNNIERLFGRELLSALRTHYMERRD